MIRLKLWDVFACLVLGVLLYPDAGGEKLIVLGLAEPLGQERHT